MVCTLGLFRIHILLRHGAKHIMKMFNAKTTIDRLLYFDRLQDTFNPAKQKTKTLFLLTNFYVPYDFVDDCNISIGCLFRR